MALGRDSSTNLRIGMSTSGFVQGAKRVGNSVKKMNSEFTRFYRGLRTGALYSGIAILARELGAAAKALIVLGQEAKNVKIAFNNLADPNLMGNLRTATKNMVSDFELMKNAVQFMNFGLDQNKLPQFLAFAQRRALETGESMDHLVRSIVVGLGRKSIKVIDNLSLNVSRFKDIVKETGDWSAALNQIIGEDMATSAKLASNEVLTLGVAWDNLKLSLAPTDTDFSLLTNFLKKLTEVNEAMKKDFQTAKRTSIVADMDEIADKAEEVRDRVAEIKADDAFKGNKDSVLAHMASNLEKMRIETIALATELNKLGSGEHHLSVVDDPGPTDEEKAAALKLERAIAKAIADQLRDTERRADALRNINEANAISIDAMQFGESDVELMEQVNDLLKARIGFEAELAQTVGLFEPPEQLADEWKVVTDDIEDNWTSAMTSMINSIARLAQRTKIEFKDIAGILLSVGGLIASGGITAGIGGIISALFGKKATGGMASGLTLVGEAGPELVNFTQPARVHSAPATQRLLGGGGGGEVVFHISGDSLVGVLNQKQTKKEYFG